MKLILASAFSGCTEILRYAGYLSPCFLRATKYRTLYPSVTPAQVARLFGWTKAQAVTALAL